jgi:hypothetical protein
LLNRTFMDDKVSKYIDNMKDIATSTLQFKLIFRLSKQQTTHFIALL